MSTSPSTSAQSRWEIFEATGAAAGQPIGLLYRRWDDRELVTEAIFADHHATSTITLNEKRWITSRFVEDGEDPVILNAESLIEEDDAIIDHMEFLVLRDAIATLGNAGDHTISYHVIIPSDPHGVAQDASMWQPADGVWEIERGGDLVSTHWVEDGRVVRSDWRGATSRPVSAREAGSKLRGIIDDDELNRLLATEPEG